MMTIARMKTKAIVSDIMAEANPGETRGVRFTHAKGINVLSADGSARYVDVSYLGDDPMAAGTPLWKALTYTTGTEKNVLCDLYWERVDAAP